VITTGAYADVRNPGYILRIILAFGGALAPGSLWALLPCHRARDPDLQDATLQRELPGYADFAVCVGYKWIPGIWQRFLPKSITRVVTQRRWTITGTLVRTKWWSHAQGSMLAFMHGIQRARQGFCLKCNVDRQRARSST
jgi:hypothetical protein